MPTTDLLEILPQVGRLAWIGLRPARRAPMRAVEEVEVLAERGLVGDRASKAVRIRPSSRQVTLFQAEHLAVLAAFMGRPLRPELLRRNLHIAGLNLHALKGRCFTIGPVLFEYTDTCDPCSRMEDALGPGGLNAMRMHGGITTRVLEGGIIRVGDPVRAA